MAVSVSCIEIVQADYSELNSLVSVRGIPALDDDNASLPQISIMGRSQEAKRKSGTQSILLFPAPTQGEETTVHPLLTIVRVGNFSHSHRTANWSVFNAA